MNSILRRSPAAKAGRSRLKRSASACARRLRRTRACFRRASWTRARASFWRRSRRFTAGALDLGCGWGAVGVLLGKKYPDVSLLMADVNERAVALAAKNLARNGVKNARAVESDVYENVDGTFDFIVTNPPIRAGKAVIYSMFDGRARPAFARRAAVRGHTKAAGRAQRAQAHAGALRVRARNRAGKGLLGH